MSKLSCAFRRIGIFVFYDSRGRVDNYVEVLLSSMQKVLEKLIVVVNGTIEFEDYQKLEKYSQNIFIRENYGYDAGAYKDVFTKFLSNESWKDWDELVLFNDTFYGPIYPWEDIFQKMDKEQSDFWGLSRHPGGTRKLTTGESMPQHIQAYFLVCRKSMFLSLYWMEFWNALEYPKTYGEAVEKFEIYFSKYFIEKGYMNKAYIDNCRIKLEYTRNPYLDYFYELIKYEHFPVIKRKVFNVVFFDNVEKTMDYLKNNKLYDIKLIYSHIKRLYREKGFEFLKPFDSRQLELFYNMHRKIYIYGHGVYGRGFAKYFEYRGWRYESFLVTEKKNEDSEELVYGNVKFNIDDGIILALGEAAFYEVYPIIKEELDDKQLYYFKYNE